MILVGNKGSDALRHSWASPTAFASGISVPTRGMVTGSWEGAVAISPQHRQ